MFLKYNIRLLPGDPSSLACTGKRSEIPSSSVNIGSPGGSMVKNPPAMQEMQV